MRVRAIATLLIAGSLTALGDRFDEWDQNKDGKLERAELPAGPRSNFERVDSDGDGLITREEHAAFLRRFQRRERRDAAASENYRALRNLNYAAGENPRQALDLFLPKAKSEEPRPLLVFIHGGAWRAGSKQGGLRRLLPYLTAGDYAGAAINYRLTGEASWPAQIHDCKAAIRWLRAHAEEYGYDPDRIAVWGTSAGGHLVAMLGMGGDVAELEGRVGTHLDQSSRVTCVVNYFGPANLLTIDDHPSDIDHGEANSPESKLVGGKLSTKPEIAREASPVTHVNNGDAPILLAHGTKDRLVPYMQSVEFAKECEEAGVPVVFITMEGAGHGFRSEELERRVTAFLGKHLRGQKVEVSSEAIPVGR